MALVVEPLAAAGGFLCLFAFTLPMQMLGADLQAHKVIYNNNSILKRCLTNTGIQPDGNNDIAPIKGVSDADPLCPGKVFSKKRNTL